MGGISGKLLGLKINGAFVSCETECTFTYDIDMLPSSATDSGRWKEFIYGIRTWGMSVNGNALLESVGSDFKTIVTTGLMQGLPMFLQFSTRPSSDIEMIISGTGLIKGGTITAAVASTANWTANFQGTGVLSTTYHDYNLLIDALPAEAAYPIVVDEGFYTT